LNVGLNVSRTDYVACIDVDCVLELDALLKMVKPFLEGGDKKVIATVGVVRIANNCKVISGRISEINMPEKMLPRFQVLAYVRSFMLGRMAWSKLNGLLIISGAFGMFDRKIAIEAG
jgi:cellulose synthase/poly-beta-1,6-N-acetylglucosamine synthase-like glycosyltransferase